MALPKDYPEPAQLLAFVLCPSATWDANLLDLLKQTFGALRHTGTLQPFDRTTYYKPEMGDGLFRGVVSFGTLIAPESIGEFKQRSNELEQLCLRQDLLRSVNIDVGYMDVDKVVLPSYKRGPFKLYADNGLWLDMLLTYAKGTFHPTAWAFEDFARNPYQKDLLLVREKYKKALKDLRASVADS